MVPGEASLFIQREAMPTVKDTYFADDARGLMAEGKAEPRLPRWVMSGSSRQLVTHQEADIGAFAPMAASGRLGCKPASASRRNRTVEGGPTFSSDGERPPPLPRSRSFLRRARVRLDRARRRERRWSGSAATAPSSTRAHRAE